MRLIGGFCYGVSRSLRLLISWRVFTLVFTSTQPSGDNGSGGTLSTNPKLSVTCKHCGGKAEAEVSPGTWDDDPVVFNLAERCSTGCAPSYMKLTREEAREMTKHSYDGKTGLWARLPS